MNPCLFRVLLVAAVLALVPDAHARPRDAEAWVALNVAPSLVRELSSHPRFRGESIRVVVFADDRPAASSNAFAMSLRNRLAGAIFDTPGIRMAADRTPGDRLDCTASDIDYYIGMQISYLGSDEYRIDLRTLDIADRTWVTGFDLTWQGALTQSQQTALEQRQADPWFRGARTAPYDPEQSDLLAANLARDLACASLRQTVGEYVVHLEPDNHTAAGETAELVRSNLAALASLQFTDDPARANAVMRGQSHVVDTGLVQFWATIAPVDAVSDLPTLTANAYVSFEPAEPDPLESLLSSQAVLTTASLVDSGDSGVALQVAAKRDAVVFFLNHQKNHGLVRLADRDCRSRPQARVVRADETLRKALPVSKVEPDAAAASAVWTLNPQADTYYAVAVSDSETAHLLARHIQKLPQRCTSAVRFGLRDAALERWLMRFAGIVGQRPGDVDWQAVQVRNVY
ncbi:MAG: hypothetical protein QNI96_15325 [Woeseiaceae bacterium]|nr:hypothetical protein [Woeseiaceae bacterium]